MAAAKPEIVKFSKNQDKRRCISVHRQEINETSTALSRFWVQLSNEIKGNTVQFNRKWKNPRWRPQNLHCVYLRFQTGQTTKCTRNSNSLTYVFEVQHSTGTYGKTLRPNRKWKNPRWRPPNFKCMYLRFQTRYQRNSNGYAYVFGV